MGAYLSKPIFEPETVCDSGHGMAFGASSVQGWRITQEDAHNCILDFDEDCSLFAVYDGHGGSEVSKYCSLYLPKFIKKLRSYQAGDCKEALIDAFVKFDQTLTKPEVVEVLKQLAQDGSDSDGVESDEDERAALAREAEMPLEDLIRSYQGHKEKEGGKKSATPEKKNGKVAEEENDESCGDDKANRIKAENADSKAGKSASKEETDNKKTAEVNEAGDLSSEENTNGGPDKPDEKGEPSSSKQVGGSSSSEEVTAASSSNSEVPAKSAAGTTTERAAQRRAAQKIRDKLSEEVEDDDDEEDDDEDEEEDDDEDEAESGEEQWSTSEEDSEDEEVGTDPNGDDDVEVFDSDVPGSGSGSTAVVAIIKGDVLTVANAGDSRAVLCREGKAMDLSVDHKPEDALERARIERAGGRVTGDGRVNGGLNLSRAIGDHVYKQNDQLTLQEQMISPLPDVQTVLLDRSKDDFLVLACDGIWNCMTSQEVCDFVSACILAGDHLGKICEQLFRKCIAPDTSGDGTGCDNMTCIIVRLNTESLQNGPAAEAQETTESGHCNGAGTANNKRTSEEDTPSKKARVSS